LPSKFFRQSRTAFIDAVVRMGRTTMNDVAGDRVVIATPQGEAEATRMGDGEVSGQSRWWIKHPWGAEMFYGTAEQATVYMQARSAERGAGKSRSK
jgi:hypothetical protein